jgi:hypothetical protein
MTPPLSKFPLVDAANSVILVGELVCWKFAEEGCNVAINYNSSADRAATVAKKIEQDYGMKAITIQGVGEARPRAFTTTSYVSLRKLQTDLANFNNRTCESGTHCYNSLYAHCCKLMRHSKPERHVLTFVWLGGSRKIASALCRNLFPS